MCNTASMLMLVFRQCSYIGLFSRNFFNFLNFSFSSCSHHQLQLLPDLQKIVYVIQKPAHVTYHLPNTSLDNFKTLRFGFYKEFEVNDHRGTTAQQFPLKARLKNKLIEIKRRNEEGLFWKDQGSCSGMIKRCCSGRMKGVVPEG